MGGACTLRQHSTNRGLYPKLDLHASYGGAGHQNVENYRRHEHRSIARWTNHKVHCSPI